MVPGILEVLAFGRPGVSRAAAPIRKSVVAGCGQVLRSLKPSREGEKLDQSP
jgi:hypothetical protein